MYQTFSYLISIFCLMNKQRLWNLMLWKQTIMKSFLFFFSFSFGCTRGMQKFLGQGSNLSHSSDNTESLTARLPGNSLKSFPIVDSHIKSPTAKVKQYNGLVPSLISYVILDNSLLLGISSAK